SRAAIADGPRTLTRVTNAHLDLTDEQVRQFPAGSLRHDARIAEFAVEAAAHDHLDAGAPRQPGQSLGVPTDLVQGHVADRPAAAPREFLELPGHHVLIVDDEFVAGVMIHGIDE